MFGMQAQVVYMVGTLVALDYLHDTWFYWTHRALHWRPLYTHIHYMHHQCDLYSGRVPWNLVKLR